MQFDATRGRSSQTGTGFIQGGEAAGYQSEVSVPPSSTTSLSTDREMEAVFVVVVVTHALR